MKKAVLLILISSLSSLQALASDEPTCEITARHGWYNHTIGYTRPLSLDECEQKAEDILSSTAIDKTSVLNPLNGDYTVRTYRIEPRTVVMKYDSVDGVHKRRLKRPDAQKTLVGEPDTIKVSVMKCWTRGECDPVAKKGAPVVEDTDDEDDSDSEK